LEPSWANTIVVFEPLARYVALKVESVPKEALCWSCWRYLEPALEAGAEPEPDPEVEPDREVEPDVVADPEDAPGDAPDVVADPEPVFAAALAPTRPGGVVDRVRRTPSTSPTTARAATASARRIQVDRLRTITISPRPPVPASHQA
jgi:hypothetical protein